MYINEYKFIYKKYFISNTPPISPPNPPKKPNNSWVYKSFSMNTHLCTTNTLYPVLQPLPPNPPTP